MTRILILEKEFIDEARKKRSRPDRDGDDKRNKRIIPQPCAAVKGKSDCRTPGDHPGDLS
jgi:hypothetical protein